MGFGDVIRGLREEREWSLRDLAGKSGLSVSHLHYIEKNTTLPGDETLKRLAQALHVRVAVLRDERETARLERALPEDVTLLLKEEGPLSSEQRRQLLRAAEEVLRNQRDR